MKITIYDVVDYERNHWQMRSDIRREGEDAVMSLVYAEEEAVRVNGWNNLPFVHIMDIAEDVDDMVSEAIDEYVTYRTDFHYIRPKKVIYKIEL